MLEDRIFRCGASDFYGDEIGLCNSTHTDDRLKAISDAGFNGIWLRAKLRDLAPGKLFNDFVDNPTKRLSQLIKLCRRAQKFQLGIWLNMIEPHGLETNHPFWKTNPDLAGPSIKILQEPRQNALCSSTPQVRDFLSSGFNKLFSKAPLRGVILMTSSEQVNNCWAHVLSSPQTYSSPETFWFKRCQCPRCEPRGPIEIISEILNLVTSGIKLANPQARVVAWDWSWNMHCEPPYKQIVDRLDKNIILMGDFERGGFVQRAGKNMEVEEYSLCYPGPSARFRKETRMVENNRPMFAKLQLNTTHELATVPNLPLVVSLYRKFSFLRNNKAAGFMGTWNFACNPDTLNTFAVNLLCQKKNIGNETTFLKHLARKYFGKEVDHKNVIKAWYAFLRAGQSYPINGNKFVYWSCVNYALGYPLKIKFDDSPMGPSWLPHNSGSRPEASLGGLTLPEVVALLKKLSASWQKGLELYQNALAPVAGTKNANKEIATAVIAGCSFRSTYNVYRWYRLRRRKTKTALGTSERVIVIDEIENLKNALLYIKNNDEFGYHEESKWRVYDETTINNKIQNLSRMII